MQVLKAAAMVLATCALLGGFCLTAAAQPTIYSASVDRPYDDVVLDVKFAITQQNFRITGGNTIGRAIAKRHNIPFPASEVIHFCNLEYARRFIEISPAFLIHMPCKVVVREADGRVLIETQLLPEDDPKLRVLTREVNAILRRIVDEAAGAW